MSLFGTGHAQAQWFRADTITLAPGWPAAEPTITITNPRDDRRYTFCLVGSFVLIARQAIPDRGGVNEEPDLARVDVYPSQAISSITDVVLHQ